MGWESPDLYSQPEAFGLRVIGELNDPEACYSFRDLVVWQHEETGMIYYATDSGCSCPSPFEDFTSLDKATEVRFLNDFIDALEDYFNAVAPYTGDYDWRYTWNSEDLPPAFASLKADALELFRLVREAYVRK